MGGHSTRPYSRSYAIPIPDRLELPKAGHLVSVKFPHRGNVAKQIDARVDTGQISAQEGAERLNEAMRAIDRAKERIRSHTDQVGGLRARRAPDNQVQGTIPMGTFGYTDERDAKATWEIATDTQRELALLGVGDISWTSPVQYESIRDGARARMLDPESAVKIGRKVKLWSKRQAYLSIDFPAKAQSDRREFYDFYNNLQEAGCPVRRVGYSTYVGQPRWVLKLYEAAQQLGIDRRA